jgi:hypothetical protein
MLVSKDFDVSAPELGAEATLIVIMLNASGENGKASGMRMGTERLERAEMKIQEIAEAVETHTEMIVVGRGLMDREIEKTASETLHVLLPLGIVLIIIILFAVYRTAIDTLLGLIGLGMAILWMYGFAVLMGLRYSEMTTAAPILILGLGIDYGIHIILRYREELCKGRAVAKSIASSVGAVGAALLLATVTTVVGFLANLTSPVPLVAEFGVFCAFGIVACFIIFCVFVPGVRQLVDEFRKSGGAEKYKAVTTKAGRTSPLTTRGLVTCTIAAERHPRAVICVIILTTALALYGALNVETGFSQEDFLPADSETSVAISYIQENFNASMMHTAIIVITGEVADAEVLGAIAETVNNTKDDRYVTISGGLPQVESVLVMMQKYAEPRSPYYNPEFAENYRNADTNGDGIPDINITKLYDWLFAHDPGAQYILHRSNIGGNYNYDGTLVKIGTTATTQAEACVLWEELEADSTPLEKLESSGKLDSVVITGSSIVMYTVTSALEESQIRSIATILVVCLIVLTVVYVYLRKSLILGLITLFPVSLVLLWILGTMFMLGMKLNAMTITISALTIGLGITYSIHVTQRFIEELDKYDSVYAACRHSVAHTGTALFGAAATTIAGFGVLSISSMPPLQQFGALMALIILYSFLSAVFVLPVLLVGWAKWRLKTNKKPHHPSGVSK